MTPATKCSISRDECSAVTLPADDVDRPHSGNNIRNDCARATEPLVQREVVQALMLNGTGEASRILLQAIASASGRSRDTLLNERLDAVVSPVDPADYAIDH